MQHEAVQSLYPQTAVSISKLPLRVGEESYYIKQTVITYAGVPHMGCNEMWACPAFWPHFTEKVKQYIETIQQTPKGAGAPLGRCRRQHFVDFCSMYCLTFSVKCGQNVGHAHISLHPMWGMPAYVITFCLM